MKAKQVGNKLILIWEKGDEIKIGETITIELENKPSEECIECKKNNGKWCDKHREEAIIEACSPRKTNTDQYTEDMPSTQSPHPLTSTERKLTDEQEIILSCWYQWAYETKRGRYAGGLSALESCESYLRKNKIINSLGNKNKNIIW